MHMHPPINFLTPNNADVSHMIWLIRDYITIRQYLNDYMRRPQANTASDNAGISSGRSFASSLHTPSGHIPFRFINPVYCMHR
jgi:hypothetical protein